MLWRRRRKKKWSRQLFFRMHFSVLHVPRTMVTSPTASGHLMCWDHLVSRSRCSCWCLWSCVFFHRTFLVAGCSHLVRGRAAWLSVKKKKSLLYTLKSAVDVWILVLDTKGAFWGSDRCGCDVYVCVHALCASERKSEGAGRKGSCLSRLCARRPVYS